MRNWKHYFFIFCHWNPYLSSMRSLEENKSLKDVIKTEDFFEKRKII